MTLIVDDNSAVWLKKSKATYIGQVKGISFYEDPKYGEDAGLWAVYRGEAQPTDYFSVPDAEEVGNARSFMDCYRRHYNASEVNANV